MNRPNPSILSQTQPGVFSRSLLTIGVFGSALLAGFTPAALFAQDQSPQFTLPDTSPTPSPIETSPAQTPAPTTAPTRAPQGPEDELSGVPIGPRVIPRNPQTTPAARANVNPSPSPAPSPTPSPARAQSPSPSSSPAPPPPSDAAPARIPPLVRNADAPGAVIGGSSPSQDNTASPGFDALGEELDGNVPRSADGWYNVDEAGSDAQGSDTPPSQTVGNAAIPSQASATVWDRLAAQSGILAALLALVAVFVGMAAWLFLRRKRASEADLDAPATALTAGVRASMGDEADIGATAGTATGTAAPEPAPAKAKPVAPPPSPTPPAPAPPAPTPTAPTEPPRLDVALDVIGATRSLMRLSVEFSLEITNRAQNAVRDIDIAGELACAQEGSVGVSPVDKTQSFAAIDRLAPQQSRRVTGTLQLPVSQITAIKQNGKPVVIPLIHLRLGSSHVQATKRTFVLGTPSSSSVTRVHPLLLDGPPGSLPPLRAQLIKTPA